MKVRALLTAVALALASAPSHAQTVWLGGIDDWFMSANWSLGVSSAAVDARISNGGTAQILAGSAEVQQLMLGSMGGESGTLTLMNAGASLAATTLILGDAGSGTLSITADADLMADTVTIANSGGTSTATISGAGSTLTTSGTLTVGRAGTGTITIDTGAVVTAEHVQLGSQAGGIGTAMISGAGSQWNVSGQFTIGGGLSGSGPGAGSLTISNGAVVDVSNAMQGLGQGVVVIGNQVGTVGEATVTGAGSTLIASNVIFLGNRGQGAMTISAGALAQTDGTAIGYENGSVGTMLVTGAGSRYEDTLNIYVGNLMGSTGTLTIADDGTVAITGAFNVLRIADGAGSTGTVNIGNGAAPGVLSAGSVSFGNGTGVLNFNHTGLLTFGVPITGDAGTVNKLGAGDTLLTGVSTFDGSLVVRGGSVQLGGSGQINNSFGSIAPEIGDLAAVLVSNGSRWTTSTGSIFTGGLGDGLLQIESGGVVESGGEILVGRFAVSRGELVVTGAGSSASSVGELRVADEGLGILRIENGGVLTSFKGFLARNAGTANATATITGAGSTWNIANEINVGGFGDATLTISAGGVLTSGTGAAYNYIGGYDANGSGLVAVTGAGSTWTLGSTLSVADAGIATPGELRVLAGGAVSGTGLGIGATGSLTVTDPGSTLTMSNGISITGSAAVESGAVVSNPAPFNSGLSLDGFGMTPTSLRIDGAGSQWTTADFVTVGFSGPANLTIRDGGVLNDGRAFVSFTSTGRGNVIVEGAGSAWNHLGNAPDYTNGFLFVGGDGNASLTIRSGGIVTTQNANINSAAIALNPSSTSTVLVTGAGSAWMNAGNVVVGAAGNGTLDIADGATVTAGSGTGTLLIGFENNSHGTVNIGTGAAPGTLSTGSVVFAAGAGTRALNFNHTGSLAFAIPISGPGVVNKLGAGTTTLSVDSSYSGGTLVTTGVLRVTNPNGLGLGSAPATVAGQGAGTDGGLLFSGNADAGAIFINNLAGNGLHGGGITAFANNATAGTAVITMFRANVNGEDGGRLHFFDTATAGSSSIYNQGPVVFQSAGQGFGVGITEFFDGSTAGSATIANEGSAVLPFGGGQTRIGGSATAGSAAINNLGGTVFNGFGGATVISGNGSAGQATITNRTGPVSGGGGGFLGILGSATASNATIVNEAASFSGSLGRGSTAFSGTSTAGAARIESRGASVASADGGLTTFFQSSTAGSSTLTAFAAGAANAGAGEINFVESSSAGTAALRAGGSSVSNALGGIIRFLGTSTASAANIIVDPFTSPGAGGRMEFRDNADAGTAAITIGIGGLVQFLDTSSALGATFTLEPGNYAGPLEFRDDSTAGHTTITAAPRAITYFQGTSDAGSATFINQGDTIGPGAFGGSVTFGNSATAMNATIINRGGSVDYGFGYSNFFGNSSAGSAQITCEGALAVGSPGAVLSGGALFYDTSGAGSATITAEGNVVSGAMGGFIFFAHSARAENAMLITTGGINGGLGGTIQFLENSSGGNATVIADGNGMLDITALASSGTTLGSIAGSGSFLLGSKDLTVGSNNTSTLVSGSVSGTGALTKVGAGTLTLSGVQNYSTLHANGGTTIVASALGTGASVANVNATARFTTDQTLAALHIGPAGVVTLTADGAAGLASDSADFRADSVQEFEPFLSASLAAREDRLAAPVPEPGAVALLLAGLAGLLARRGRRPA